MSKPDKPIFNQQGGRGKLYGPTHGATYMGTYQMCTGDVGFKSVRLALIAAT